MRMPWLTSLLAWVPGQVIAGLDASVRRKLCTSDVGGARLVQLRALKALLKFHRMADEVRQNRERRAADRPEEYESHINCARAKAVSVAEKYIKGRPWRSMYFEGGKIKPPIVGGPCSRCPCSTKGKGKFILNDRFCARCADDVLKTEKVDGYGCCEGCSDFYQPGVACACLTPMRKPKA